MWHMMVLFQVVKFKTFRHLKLEECLFTINQVLFQVLNGNPVDCREWHCAAKNVFSLFLSGRWLMGSHYSALFVLISETEMEWGRGPFCGHFTSSLFTGRRGSEGVGTLPIMFCWQRFSPPQYADNFVMKLLWMLNTNNIEKKLIYAIFQQPICQYKLQVVCKIWLIMAWT